MQTSQREPAVDAAESRSDTVSALERGISVLRCFSQERPVLGHADIVRLRAGEHVLPAGRREPSRIPRAGRTGAQPGGEWDRSIPGCARKPRPANGLHG